MKTNVVFLNPPYLKGYNRPVRFQAVSPQKAFHPPLYLAYGAAVCEKNGYSVALIDAPAEDLNYEITERKIENLNPEYIVILCSTASIENDTSIARKLKTITDATSIAVGAHPTALPRDALKSGFDVVARREYEYTLLDILSGKQLRDIEGISFNVGENIIHNSDRPLIQNLDELPFPARHLLSNEKYFSGILKNPFTFILSGRGCPFNCIFCVDPQVMMGRKYRVRGPRNVVDELEYIESNFNIKSVLFNDDTLTANPKRLSEICNLIMKRGIDLPWACYSRVGNITLELAKKMKRANCFLVKIGYESGSNVILSNMKKGISTKQARVTTKIFKKVGIQIHGTFIFGMPGETKDTIKKTIEFAKEIDPDYVQFSIAQPYPGTLFFEILKKNGSLRPTSWAEYLDTKGAISCVFEYPYLSKKDIVNAVRTAYKEFYLRPKYIGKIIKSRIICPKVWGSTLKAAWNVLNYAKKRYN